MRLRRRVSEPSNGRAFIKVTLGVVATLVAAGIVGGLSEVRSTVQRLSTVEANYTALAKELAEVKADVKTILKEMPR